MNILVTGSNGQLGNEIRLVARNSKDKYFFTDVCEEHPESIKMLHKLGGEDVCTDTSILDITSLEDIRTMVKEHNIKVIVNCAAFTNVDAAESNQELAELLNAKAPENLAIVMKDVDGLLIHISTDYVYGGDPYNTPCKEDLKGTPSGIYGLTKLRGEDNIQKTGVNYIILRTAWLYSEFGKNFVKTMLDLTKTKPQLKVVFDQTGTPTYAFDLARAIVDILESRKYDGNTGVYHYSNEGVCSWFDFTKMIAVYSGHTQCDIQPCHSDEFPSTVKRPAYSVLDKTKIKEQFRIKIPFWVNSLQVCLRQLE